MIGYLIPAAAIVGAIVVIVYDRRKTRRTLQTLDRMLDAAIRGAFREEDFDESLLSAVETRLADYLSASAVSARNLQQEKDKIKELISDISHQTKTPIANVLLYSQLLAEQQLPEESRNLVTALGGQAEKLQSLIDALVKISRLETGILQFQPKQKPIALMLSEAAARFTPKAEAKGITLTWKPSDIEAVFDGEWTAEALCNLLDNAIKYTPVGGTVSMRATPYELFCRIDIEDTGIGIPEPEQARIFQRFYRSPSSADTEGVGIGLYLAREIISGQGGYIKLKSAPGEGSIFSVFLSSN